MSWNPSSPGVLGVEWSPSSLGSVSLVSDAAGVAVRFEAEASVSVTTLGLVASVLVGGPVALDLYTEADYLAASSDAVTASWFPPTAEVAVHPYVRLQVGSDRIGAVDEQIPALPAQATGGSSEHLYNQVFSDGAQAGWLYFRFGGLTVAAGRRVLGLRYRVAMYAISAVSATWTSTFRGFLDSPSGARTDNLGIITWVQPTTTKYGLLEWAVSVDPATGQPIRAADLAAWAATGAFGHYQTSSAPVPPGNAINLNTRAVNLLVEHIAERRLAWAEVSPAVGASQVLSATLTTPAGGSSVALTAGQRYVLLARRPAGSAFQATVPLLSPPAPHAGYAAGAVTLDGYGRPTSPPAAAGAVPLVAIGASKVGGQSPYSAASLTDVGGGRRIRQTFTGVADDYSTVTVPAVAGAPGSTLTIAVHRTSDGAQVGGSGEVTTEDWAAAAGAVGPLGEKAVRVDLTAPAVLAAGTSYYVEATSDAAGDAPWRLVQLDAPTPWANETGSGLVGWFAGSTSGSLPASDVPFRVGAQPDPPATAAVALVAVDLGSGDGTGYQDGAWDVCRLSWSATSLGTGFDFYEVQRGEDGAWSAIGRVLAEGTTSFDDYEAKRGRPVSYRVRVVRPDGVASSWSEAPGTVTPVAHACAVGLVSNAEAGGVVLADLADLRTWTDLDAGQTTLRPLYGADYQAAFRSTERRGVRASFTVLVGSGDAAPGVDGLDRFDRLRDLAHRADVPYLAVLDDVGSRVFASVVVPELRHRRLGEVYTATVEATEISGTPAVVDAGEPLYFTFDVEPLDSLDGFPLA